MDLPQFTNKGCLLLRDEKLTDCVVTAACRSFLATALSLAAGAAHDGWWAAGGTR